MAIFCSRRLQLSQGSYLSGLALGCAAALLISPVALARKSAKLSEAAPAKIQQEEKAPSADQKNALAEPVNKKQRLMLTAAVLRYDKNSIIMTREQWLQIMDEISALGIKTIIIQHHHFVPRVAQNGPAVPELDFLPRRFVRALPETAVAKPETNKAVPSTTVKVKSTAVKKSASVVKEPGTVTKDSPSGSREPSPASKEAPPQAREAEKKNQHAEKVNDTAGGAMQQVDASGIILDYADAHDMRVYMGLWMDLNWYPNLDVMDQLANNLARSKSDLVQLQNEMTDKKANPSLTAKEISEADAEIEVFKRGQATVQHELDEKSEYFAARKDGALAGPCITMADDLIKYYGKHPSFVGWYFPEEIWDAAFSNETISVLNPFLKLVCNHCREVSEPVKRTFVMSPYASRLHYDSLEAIVAAQKELLKDTGVDVLMLQDSIGDQALREDEDIAVRLKKHFTAFRDVAATLKMKLWAELETFEQVGTARKPATVERFKKQFQYSFPYLDQREPIYAAFDYLRYLSLSAPKFPLPEERAKFYDDYKRDFVDGAFTPIVSPAAAIK